MADRREVDVTFELCHLYGYRPCLWLEHRGGVLLGIRRLPPRMTREMAGAWEGQTLSEASRACRSYLLSQSPPPRGYRGFT